MRLKKSMVFRILFVLLILWIGSAYAGNVTQQTVTLKIDPINLIQVRDDLSSWSITTNEVNKRVMGRIKTSGIVLSLKFEAPSNGISEGFVTLTSEMQCLVKNISKVAESDLKISCEDLSDIEGAELEFMLTD
ncbi:MAG: hypothetical protein AMJ90_01300 [candidate division Zixibacteria bacterium SM23_73_2]|nr:MAG: hypothetical protein AMJ90_01300 [candidate division Zixibacteria bacterium SM23_73_2]